MSSNPGGGKPGGRAAIPAAPTQFGVESVKAPDITGSLDFTALIAAKPAPNPAPQAQPAVPPRDRLEPAIRDAALLHANGQAAAAKARLAKALDGELTAKALERGWLMLLELHQVLGERAPFEERSIAFAEKFLRSAPAWRNTAAQPVSPMLQTGGGAFVSLTGKLSSESAAQMQKVRELALRNRALRLDFAKLQGADGPGCRVLIDLLQATRRAGVDLVLNGESMLLGALARATRAGAKDVDPGLWLLRLEILQAQGRQEEFDALALDYAVTFEESPPSFEPLAARPVASPVAPAPASPGAQGEGIELPAEVAGPIGEWLQRIELAAALQDRITLDCTRTTRIDVAAAGALRPLAERLATGGTPVEFRHPTALGSALLDATGVRPHAQLLERS